jgi:hypothetical protein
MDCPLSPSDSAEPDSSRGCSSCAWCMWPHRVSGVISIPRLSSGHSSPLNTTPSGSRRMMPGGRTLTRKKHIVLRRSGRIPSPPLCPSYTLGVLLSWAQQTQTVYMSSYWEQPHAWLWRRQWSVFLKWVTKNVKLLALCKRINYIIHDFHPHSFPNAEKYYFRVNCE